MLPIPPTSIVTIEFDDGDIQKNDRDALVKEILRFRSMVVVPPGMPEGTFPTFNLSTPSAQVVSSRVPRSAGNDCDYHVLVEYLWSV